MGIGHLGVGLALKKADPRINHCQKVRPNIFTTSLIQSYAIAL